MRFIPAMPIEILSDKFLFPSIQLLLIVFSLFCVARHFYEARKARRSGIIAAIKRGEASMGRFFAAYALLSGWFITLCLSVDIAQNHRVLWVSVDTILVAYVCLLNPWFRNRILGWIAWLSKVEN